MLFALLAVVRGVAGPAPFVKSAVTFYISITGLVYNFLLTRMVSPEQLQIISPLSNMLLHTVTPVMAVIDWLLFDVHGRLRWRDALLWLLYPAAYFVFALVRGALIGAGWLGGYFKYPYPFLNVDTLGNGGVARNFMIYGVGFWLLGLLFVALDRLIKRLQRVQVS